MTATDFDNQTLLDSATRTLKIEADAISALAQRIDQFRANQSQKVLDNPDPRS